MSEDLKFGLGDLVVGDDLDISLDNDTYQDQAAGGIQGPVAAGDYLVKIGTLYPATYRGGDKKGQPILRDEKFPVLTLGSVEIVEGLGDGVTRKVGLFQDINTKPYIPQQGPRKGIVVSQLNDLARSLGLASYHGFDELRDLLNEAIANGQTFGVSLNWESGYDKAFVEAAISQLGLKDLKRESMTDEQRKLSNAIQYRYSRVQGQKNFTYNEDTNTFSPKLERGNVVMKVGEKSITVEVEPRVLEARNVIPVFFNDMKFISRERVESGQVTFGPYIVKRPVAA